MQTYNKNLAARIDMDSDNQQRCHAALYEADASASRTCVPCYQGYSVMKHWQERMEDSQEKEILAQMHSQQRLIVNSRRRNGLIIYKRYHAEFAGPGAAVGGDFDKDCQRTLPVGNLSLIYPETADERQRAYLIRRQWIRLTTQITNDPVPVQRAQRILTQFQQYFDAETVARVPDDAFALLVGVLPQTIRRVREQGPRE